MTRQTRATAGKLPEDKCEPVTPRFPSRVASSRRRARLREVKNSSDLSSDGESVPTALLRVVVPAPHPETARSTRSTTSAATSTHEYSSHEEQDTPLTSAIATPFEVTVTRASSRRIVNADFSNLSKRLSTVSTRSRGAGRSRRKSQNMDLDEQMACKLQEEEYAGQVESTLLTSAQDLTTKQQRRLDRHGLVDSDDDESCEEDLITTPAPLKRKLPDRQLETEPQQLKRKRVAPASHEHPKRKSHRNAHTVTPLGIDQRLTTVNESDDSSSSIAGFADVVSDDAGDGSFSLAGDRSDSSELSEIPDDAPDVSQDDVPILTSRKKSKAKAKVKRAKMRPSRAGVSPSIGRSLWRQPDESRSVFERRRLEHAHPKCKTLWSDLEQVPVVKPQQAPQPPGINRVLKSFQLEGVDWMRRMETESQWKGGLLGDEMGMGKTIQAVSLIMSDYPAGKPTLVVVPPVALMQWAAEIDAYTHGKLRVLIHHGTNSKVKKLRVKDLMEFDVIMVSYNGLQHMHQKEVKGRKAGDVLVKENSRLHAIQYHRLILDEAHSIKSRTTQIAKSCYALKADFKWCLSGTPVQNRIGEFFSLLRFLEVEPFASYFCKECSCESLHWIQDSSAKCAKCQHTLFNHVSLFNQELLHPITSGDPDERTEAMRKLRLLTDRIMLRRMKRDHVTAMELPPKKVVIHNEFFGPIECDFNKSIMTQSTRQFDTYVARGVELKNYANIFGLIMQMRQVANHPDLILKKRPEGGDKILVCAVCDEVAEEPIRSQCRHDFCRRCASDLLGECVSGASADCPTCHIPLRIDLDQPEIEQDEDAVRNASIITRINMDNWHSSTKIEALIIELFELRSKKRTAKSIVFSQFTSMLQLLEWRLRRAGFSTVMLDGSMNPNQRQNSIQYFMDNIDVEVFLVSLKAGGVALNLTEASRVFIVDPWWNPAAEWQSADRCHRIGQRRPCQITRLCIEDSVESRMVMLQEKKANLINGTVNGDDVALGKLTAEDLQFLFRGT